MHYVIVIPSFCVIFHWYFECSIIGIRRARPAPPAQIRRRHALANYPTRHGSQPVCQFQALITAHANCHFSSFFEGHIVDNGIYFVPGDVGLRF